MKPRYAGKTDTGVKRDHNEDNYMLIPELDLYVVADGMGGHASGEVASQIAVETLQQFYEESEQDGELTWPFRMDRRLDYQENRFVTAVKLANRNIFDKALEDPKYKGMGTTFVGMRATEDEAMIAHVGDSRAYRLRNGSIEQVTLDHSLLNDYKRLHTMTKEEEEAFPHKNIIVRALGMKETVEVDITRETPQAGDTYLLCSDGLTDLVSDERIRQVVEQHGDDMQGAIDQLIAEACEESGKDNITVVLVRYEA